MSNRRKRTSGGGGEETGRTNDTYIMYVYVIIKELKTLSKKCPESLLIKSLSSSVVTPNWNCIKAKKKKNWRVSLEEYLPKKVCSEVQTEHNKKLG